MYQFWYDYIKSNISEMRNYATWIQIASSFTLKLKMFMKTLQMILKNNWVHQIMKSTDHCLKEENKK